jgi:hypothetical protein
MNQGIRFDRFELRPGQRELQVEGAPARLGQRGQPASR